MKMVMRVTRGRERVKSVGNRSRRNIMCRETGY